MSDSAALHRAFSTHLVPLGRAYRRHLDRELAAMGLSHARALAVMLIARMGEGVRQGLLADALGIESPSLVPLVDQIERAGLAERRSDPADRRANLLYLTDEGRLLAQQAEEATARIRARMLDGIADDDLRAATRVLDQLSQTLAAAGEGFRP